MGHGMSQIRGAMRDKNKARDGFVDANGRDEGPGLNLVGGGGHKCEKDAIR